MEKDTRMEFRLPLETKQTLQRIKSEKHIPPSAYVREAISEKMHRDSHEYQTESMLLINKIYNLINAFPNLDKNFKDTIIKELNEYEN